MGSEEFDRGRSILELAIDLVAVVIADDHFVFDQWTRWGGFIIGFKVGNRVIDAAAIPSTHSRPSCRGTRCLGQITLGEAGYIQDSLEMCTIGVTGRDPRIWVVQVTNEKPRLDIASLLLKAKQFAEIESSHLEPTLYGVTDGKAVGTYLEHKFRSWLERRYLFETGNSAKGIDFPELAVDMKVTSIRQPQSSCPFKSPRQKIFGLGYSLLIFVYDKFDDATQRASRLDVRHVVFVEQARTADYQMTRGILQILGNNGNGEDLIAYMQDKNLPVDDMEVQQIADELLIQPPLQGYLTISNALQWRLQYARVIESAGSVDGINRIV